MATRLPGRIKLMADYECFPLWDMGPSGPGNLDPRELPISRLLIERLEAWAGKYDETLDREDPSSSGFSTRNLHRSFVEEGRRLAVQLAQEVGDGCIVLYYDKFICNLE